MSNLSFKRIIRDLEKIEKLPDKTYRALPYEENLYYWRGYIRGPQDSAYDGMMILFELNLDKKYPHNPPKMNFIPGRIFHPNVYQATGKICLGHYF